jgi:hypothetical protein
VPARRPPRRAHSRARARASRGKRRASRRASRRAPWGSMAAGGTAPRPLAAPTRLARGPPGRRRARATPTLCAARWEVSARTRPPSPAARRMRRAASMSRRRRPARMERAARGRAAPTRARAG